MKSLNQVMLLGYLGAHPELLKEKSSFARLSIATTKKYTDAKGKLKEDTQWHTVYVSHGVGKVAMEYLVKGSRVLVTGELRTHEWQDEQGQRKFSTAVYASDLILLDAKAAEKKREPSESPMLAEQNHYFG